MISGQKHLILDMLIKKGVKNGRIYGRNNGYEKST